MGEVIDEATAKKYATEQANIGGEMLSIAYVSDQVSNYFRTVCDPKMQERLGDSTEHRRSVSRELLAESQRTDVGMKRISEMRYEWNEMHAILLSLAKGDKSRSITVEAVTGLLSEGLVVFDPGDDDAAYYREAIIETAKVLGVDLNTSKWERAITTDGDAKGIGFNA